MSTDNANKLMQSPAENFIILRSVYGKVGMKYYIQPSKDPRTGQYPPCVKPVNSVGDMILSDPERNSGKIFIKETETCIEKNAVRIVWNACCKLAEMLYLFYRHK